MSGSTSKKMEIIIIHPDLGIGGAERLIVDIAKAMKVLGHSVKLYTSHHDPSRCFEETRGDGVIADCIEVHGNWLPRQIFGRCTALCAIVRMIYVSFVAVFGHYVGKSKPSLIFLDSVREMYIVFVDIVACDILRNY
jgi:alpha-1,3/alpha-1,6-mannosyltransferase